MKRPTPNPQRPAPHAHRGTARRSQRRELLDLFGLADAAAMHAGCAAFARAVKREVRRG